MAAQRARALATYLDSGYTKQRGAWVRLQVTCPECGQVHALRFNAVEVRESAEMVRFCNATRKHFTVSPAPGERAKILDALRALDSPEQC